MPYGPPIWSLTLESAPTKRHSQRKNRVRIEHDEKTWSVAVAGGRREINKVSAPPPAWTGPCCKLNSGGDSERSFRCAEQVRREWLHHSSRRRSVLRSIS